MAKTTQSEVLEAAIAVLTPIRLKKQFLSLKPFLTLTVAIVSGVAPVAIAVAVAVAAAIVPGAAAAIAVAVPAVAIVLGVAAVAIAVAVLEVGIVVAVEMVEAGKRLYNPISHKKTARTRELVELVQAAVPPVIM